MVFKVVKYWGIKEIRVTGGEPTLREDWLEIIAALSTLPLKKLAITSNGFFLEKELVTLKKFNCNHINISLDGLQADKFFKITAMDSAPVLSCIRRAKELGFVVKVNTVLLAGINVGINDNGDEDEIDDFIEWGAKNQIELRFLELIEIGAATKIFPTHHFGVEDLLQRIKINWRVEETVYPPTGTAFYLRLRKKRSDDDCDGRVYQVGIIASRSRPFCASCDRVRIDQNGIYRSCLMEKKGIYLPSLSERELSQLIVKKKKVNVGNDNLESNHMYEIGG
ncbi:MAG: radical SAM protein [Oligoflexia bacterium]|nr:radical SAM protein [Oligoflexia bacterium]